MAQEPVIRMLQSLQLQTYAGYVWSCYALTLVALMGVALYARKQWRDAERDAQRRLQIQESKLS